MNPAGIPMFYGAADMDTAVAEIAGHDSRSWATAGRFTTSRSCQVVDFTLLPPVPSMFDPDWRGLRRALIFLHRFVADLSTPLTAADRDQIDYVPTQIVMEYFRHIHGDGQTAGLLFRSAVTGRLCSVLDVPNTRCLNPGEHTDSDVLALTLAEKRTVPMR